MAPVSIRRSESHSSATSRCDPGPGLLFDQPLKHVEHGDLGAGLLGELEGVAEGGERGAGEVDRAHDPSEEDGAGGMEAGRGRGAR